MPEQAPNSQESHLREEASGLVTQAHALQVVDTQTYNVARSYLQVGQAMKNKIKGYWEEIKKPSWDIHKTIVGKEKEMLEPVETQIQALKAKMSSWYTSEVDGVLKPDVQGQRQVVKWHVMSLEAVPSEYFVLDEKRISKDIKDGKDIPGIERDTEYITVAR